MDLNLQCKTMNRGKVHSMVCLLLHADGKPFLYVTRKVLDRETYQPIWIRILTRIQELWMRIGIAIKN